MSNKPSIIHRFRNGLYKTAIILVAIVVVITFLWEVLLPGEWSQTSSITLPVPTGKFPVGRISYDWTDTSRQEQFNPSFKREIMVWVWYPAASNTENKASSYLPGKWGGLAAKSHARDLNFKNAMQPFNFKNLVSMLTFRTPLSTKMLEQIKVNEFDNAPVSNGDIQYPVLLFSPALGEMPTDYTAVIEDIVSHGYIVVGINPTYYTSSTVFPDGRQVGMSLPWKINPSAQDMINTWVSDMVFALNQITKVNESQQSPLYHRMNMSAIGAFGHSYGGAAAVGASYLDSRIKAGINIDGTPRGDSSTWEITKPFMLMQSDYGSLGSDPKMDKFYNGLKTGYLVRIKDIKHRAFSDEVLFPLPASERNMLIGTIKGERVTQITSTYVRAFFDTYLLGNASPLLNAPSAEYPEVKIENQKK